MSQTTRKRREKLKLDQIMRVLFQLSSKMTIQLVNGLFEESFVEEDVLGIRHGNSEFIRDNFERIVGDMFLTLETRQGTFHYHIEFQTLNDQSMVIRMFRYGFEKAVELMLDMKAEVPGASGKIGVAPEAAIRACTHAQAETAATAESYTEERTVLAFPQQLVIFLEENRTIGDELAVLLRLPNGAEVPYTVPVMKFWTYSAEQLRARRMYALLPLQVFNSRKRMRAIYASKRPKAEKTRLMIGEFERLKATIEQTMIILGELYDQHEIATGDLDRILRVIDSITNYLYSRYKEYQTTLEEMSQMIKTFIPQIREEGKLEGKLEGNLEGKRDVARKLLSLGADIELIVQATGFSKEEIVRIEK